MIKEMKKFYFAMMIFAAATAFAACDPDSGKEDIGNGGGNGGNNNPEQTYEPISSKVLAATFPRNVKIEMETRMSYNDGKNKATLYKIGNEWFYRFRTPRYLFYMYCQFDKDGKTLKCFAKSPETDEVYDHTAWNNQLTNGTEDFLDFAGFARNSMINVLFDAGVPAGNCKKYGEATSDKVTILGVECTRYDYDFVVKADYYVDEVTKIVYKFVNYLDKDKEQPNATFEITGWDENVTAFEWKKPE